MTLGVRRKCNVFAERSGRFEAWPRSGETDDMLKDRLLLEGITLFGEKVYVLPLGSMPLVLTFDIYERLLSEGISSTAIMKIDGLIRDVTSEDEEDEEPELEGA